MKNKRSSLGQLTLQNNDLPGLAVHSYVNSGQISWGFGTLNLNYGLLCSHWLFADQLMVGSLLL